MENNENGPWDSSLTQLRGWDPHWSATCGRIRTNPYASWTTSPKLVELTGIAFDASYTHMYVPGIRRHIKAALHMGATMEEIMEVLKLCVVQGAAACNMGIPILAEELRRVSTDEAQG